MDMDVYDGLLRALEREYDTVQRLKQSARGSVSIVRHRRSGTRFLFRQFEGSAEVYRRLLPLQCANLPQIMEVGEREGHVAVLEEWIPGDTLAFVLEGGLPTVSETRRIVRQLCGALAVLHELGAVHRDVKPENVILRGVDAVLIDFDASRLVRTEPGTVDADTRVLGTTGFAAPEQYGISQTDCRADIYSLGVLLNVMLTGEHPSKRLAPGRLGTVVQRCTMMSSQKRYSSVFHLMEAL